MKCMQKTRCIKNRIISLLLVLLMIATMDGTTMLLSAIEVSAADFEANPDKVNLGGNGTETDPYIISTSDDLWKVTQAASKASLKGYYKLIADIKIDGEWTPIGSGINSFNGTFDGNGHVITGILINDENSNEHGFFGCIADATVKDLTIVGSVCGNNKVGLLAGFDSGSSEITNCHVTGTVSGKGNNVGGLIGDNGTYNDNNSIMLDCVSECNVSGDFWVGGLVGGNSGIISRCYTKGNVLNSDYCIGGLVGSNHGEISNCYAIGNVSGYRDTGGLVGYSFGLIKDSYAKGDVIINENVPDRGHDSTYIGGLVGGSQGEVVNCHATGDVRGKKEVGGLIGSLAATTMTNCYATGDVVGEEKVGGLIGTINTATILDGYSMGNVSGSKEVGGLVGSNYHSSIISSCAMGEVSGDYYIGGLVGRWGISTYVDDVIENCFAVGDVTGNDHGIGGLIGYYSDSTASGKITNCYAVGNVSGKKAVNGLIGSNDRKNITNCYYNKANSESGDSAKYGLAKTLEELRNQDTYEDWDFDKIWGIDGNINSGYPYLKWTVSNLGGESDDKQYSNLEDYAKSHTYLCDSNQAYTGYIYREDGNMLYSCKGNVPVKPISYDIDDYDNDGKDELLIVDLDSNYKLILRMYEMVNGKVTQTAYIDFPLNGVVEAKAFISAGLNWERSAFNCFTYEYNNKNIIGLEEYYFQSSTGEGESFQVVGVSYNGDVFNKVGEYSLAGSDYDFNDYEFSCVVKNLKNIGINITSKSFSDFFYEKDDKEFGQSSSDIIDFINYDTRKVSRYISGKKIIASQKTLPISYDFVEPGNKKVDYSNISFSKGDSAKDIKPAFDLYKYQADYILNNTERMENIEKTFWTTSPCKKIIDGLDENGVNYLAVAWRAVTRTLDSIDDIGNVVDYSFEEKDAYTAIILDTLEEQVDYKYAEEINCEALKVTQKLLSSIKTDLQADAAVKVISELTDKDKSKLLSDTLKELDESGFSKFVDEVGTLEKILKYSVTIEDYCEEVAAYTYMRATNDAFKSVIDEMYNQCPQSNAALKAALKECSELIKCADEEFDRQITLGTYKMVGKEVVKYGISEAWKLFIKKVVDKNPKVKMWRLIYKTTYQTSKLVTNVYFNTDELTTQYYKMCATNELENVMRTTYRELKAKYLNDRTSTNARIYLNCLDIANLYVVNNCKTAEGYVEKLDKAKINTLAALFGCSNNNAAVKAQIESTRTYKKSSYEKEMVAWIDGLKNDYPEYYEQYNTLRSITDYRMIAQRIHCPVDVYLYDKNKQLITAVKDNYPTSSEIAVIVDGDEKLLCYPAGKNYTLDYVGNGVGDMDISIKEYTIGGEMLKTLEYYDLPLKSGKTYTASVSDTEDGYVEHILKDNKNNVVVANNDSSDISQSGYEVTVKQGMIIMDDVAYSKISAVKNASYEIIAMVPKGYEFAGWSSTENDVLFEDALSEITTIHVGNKDVVLTANISKSVDCQHTNTEIRGAKEATATTEGYTGDTYCKDCGKKLKTGQVIPIKGSSNAGTNITQIPDNTSTNNQVYDVKPVTVTPSITVDKSKSNIPKKNTKITVSKGIYRITSSNENGGTLEFVKPSKKSAAKIVIPASIIINGKTYTVTSIAAKAFKNNKKLKQVDIGKNIKKIGKQAFYNCKKLNKLVIRSKNLTNKNVGNNTFKGVNKKVKVYVPESKINSYKKLLKKKGLKKNW